MVKSHTTACADPGLQARELADQIFKTHQQLRDILATYKTTIKKRWKKKIREKQKISLKTIWPHIAAPHRPDFHVFREAKGASRIPKLSVNNALEFPDLNLEDLTRLNCPLYLLMSRSCGAPATFAHRDLNAMEVRLRAELIVPETIHGSTMYLSTSSSNVNYGRIVDWRGNPGAEIDLNQGYGIEPAKGFWY